MFVVNLVSLTKSDTSLHFIDASNLRWHFVFTLICYKSHEHTLRNVYVQIKNVLSWTETYLF